jgi:hypothetical protein
MSFKIDGISSGKKNFHMGLKQAIKNRKESNFLNRLVISSFNTQKKINIVPVKEHLNIDANIMDRSVKKVAVESKLVKSIRDLLTYKNKIEIQYLMSMGYTRLEAKQIINEINKSTTNTDERENLIKDYPTKQQKEKGYSSQSQYEDDFTASVATVKKLGYANVAEVENNVIYAQEVSTSREQFLKIIADTTSIQSRYKSKTAEQRDFKEATIILSNLGCRRSLISSEVSMMQERSTPEEFAEKIKMLKQNIAHKEELIAMIKKKGYGKQNAIDIFADIAFQVPPDKILDVIINNLPNKGDTTPLVYDSDKRN